MPSTSTEKKSAILLESVDEMNEKIGETEMHRIHSYVVPNLTLNLLERWKCAENDDLKKFIIFFPKNEGLPYEIDSMLSGEVIKKDGKKIYTILNTATEEEIRKKGRATELVEALALKIGETVEIHGSLSLESNDSDKTTSNKILHNLSDEEKKGTIENLNKRIKFSKNRIKFEENPSDSTAFKKIVDKIKNSELWEKINFKFLSSFMKKPELEGKLDFQLSIGNTTGNLILVPKIAITKELIEAVKKQTPPSETASQSASHVASSNQEQHH